MRLEVDHECPPMIREALLKTLRLREDDLYCLDGPLNPARLMTLYEGDHSPELRDPPFVAPVAAAVSGQAGPVRRHSRARHAASSSLRKLQHRAEFPGASGSDPDVLAIKQTLYRTGGDLRIIGALESAVRNGKQVTAVVELRARFDEANNISWARQLEESGVHVVYGLVGYKIHAKSCLVVRREGHHIRRYVHLATGNYNPTTARLYTDLGLLTCRPDIGEDVTNLFNLLTGICQFPAACASCWWRLSNCTIDSSNLSSARRRMPAAACRRASSPSSTLWQTAKSSRPFTRASQAGVKIDLIVRGICCLRPGVKGMSENIIVRSIVDRFLEHSRIYYFENACQPQVFVSSADWLPRNFVPAHRGRFSYRGWRSA